MFIGQSSIFLFASEVIILIYYSTAVSTPTKDITLIVLSPIYNTSQQQFINTISISIFSQFSHIHPPFLQILFHIFSIQFPVLFSHSKIAGTGVNAIFISPSLKSFRSAGTYLPFLTCQIPVGSFANNKQPRDTWCNVRIHCRFDFESQKSVQVS
ncbi:MAG: hypothetical protein EZS28_016264 [Streblomastix strix]|uniref:Uncharacterized protein n=1 Tax=Streblomastix strix TaxID=222440 RepID=A0A5J4W0A3_9EUKA|nr:MAG: hypothetical protein EZS28_016264 [Streblomastix strix]